MDHLRAIAFWLGMVLSTLVVGITLLLLFPFPWRLRHAWSMVWIRFNLWWLRVTCGLRHRVQGLEKLPDGPAIYLSKHQSAWETIALNAILPPVVWVLKRELLWVPVFGWAAALLRPVALNRARGREARTQLLDKGTQRLAQGMSVVIFPEGTRTPPGQAGRYRIGGALLAAHSGYPVVPIAHNSGYFWPRRGFVKKAGVIQLVIGEAFNPAGMSPEQINQRVQDWIENQMTHLKPELTPN